MTSGHIEYQRGDDRIAILTITQPERRNAVTYPMMEQFFDLLRQASDDEECRVIIITGAGDTFCSGTDVKYLSQIPPEKRGFQGSLHDDAGWWNITACPKPVIAAIDGYAVGMGAEWASMCDVRIGTTRCNLLMEFRPPRSRARHRRRDLVVAQTHRNPTRASTPARGRQPGRSGRTLPRFPDSTGGTWGTHVGSTPRGRTLSDICTWSSSRNQTTGLRRDASRCFDPPAAKSARTPRTLR